MPDRGGVNAAFKQLEKELEEQIRTDMEETRQQLFDAFDASIVDMLRQRGADIERTMSDFERRLWLLARAELPDAVFRNGGLPSFDFEGATWSTIWPEADERGWRFFRLGDGTLADRLVDDARSRDLPETKLVFDYQAYRSDAQPRLSDVERLSGKTGWMKSCSTRPSPPLGREKVSLSQR